MEDWLHPALNQGVGTARADTPEGELARIRLRETPTALDDQVSQSPFLAGDEVTVADLRVIVTLVRFDAQANADGALGPALETYRHLWDYARAVYQEPGVRATTRFEAFTAPGARVPDWDQPPRHRAAPALLRSAGGRARD